MKILIMTDLEGPAGVERFSQTRGDEPFVVSSKHQLAREVNAAVAGIIDAYPQAEVVVVDGHGPGGIFKEDLDPRAVYCRFGTGVNWHDNFASYAAFMYVGQHSMACTPNGPLCHTGSSKTVIYKRINNVYVGEFGIGAATAGYYGVPTIFLAGDDKAVTEAQTLIPGLYGVATKWGEGWEKARHLTSEEACSRIRQVAAEACRNIHKIKPLCFDPPYCCDIRYIFPRKVSATSRPGVRAEQVDAYTVRYRSDDFLLLTMS